MFIVAQCVSGVALVLNTTGRLFKKQSTTLFFSLIASIFTAISLLLLNAYMGFVCLLVSIIRTTVFYIYAKKVWHKNIITLIIFCSAFIGLGFVGFTNWLEYALIVLKGLTYTYGAWQHNEVVFKYFSVASNIFTIGYNAIYGGYINMLNEFICIIFSTILIYKYHYTEKTIKKTSTSK